MDNKKIYFLDYIQLFIQWRKPIIINFFIVSIIAVIISLIIPKIYSANTTILPAGQSTGLMGLSSLMGDLPTSLQSLGLPGIGTETSIYTAILNSRSVLDSVISKFDLKKVYKKKTVEETRKQLLSNTNIFLSDEGTIVLSVNVKTKFFSFGKRDDFAKNLARDMANYFTVCLDIVNKRLSSERARNSRIFIEKRYEQNLADLASSEEVFKDFQKKYGAVSIEEQTKAGILTLATLKGMLVAKEVEFNVLKNYMDKSHPEYLRTQNELQEIQAQYNQFLYLDKLPKNGKSGDIYLPFDEIPDLGMQYTRLMREVLIQQKIQELLLPMYEQAKIEEAKDTPSIQILDPAITPERKAKPKRAFIVLGAGFMSLFFSSLAVFAAVNLNFMKKNKSENYARLNSILSDLKFSKR
jgi:tyrosine-protein kinase Etk/Wzc